MLITTVTVSPFAMNCYIIASETTKQGIVIDPGDEIDTIIAAIDEQNLNISKIVNTHGHIDHTAGVKEMQERLGLPFYIHEGDLDFLKMINEQAAMFGMNTFGEPEVEGFLDEGDIVEFEDIVLKVLHTPGHSPGGICLLGDKDILVGDTLFAGSIGRTDLPGGNYDQLIQSIDTKLLPLDENLRVYSGHGPSTTVGHEKQTNPFLTMS